MMRPSTLRYLGAPFAWHAASLPRLGWAAPAALFIAAYLGLDWLSSTHSLAGIAITPWSPAAGLTLATLLITGPSFLPVVLIADVASSALLSSPPPTLLASLLGAGVKAATYASTAAFLSRTCRLDVRLARLHDLVAVLCAAPAAAAVAAAGFVGAYALAGGLPTSRVMEAWLQFWIGDTIGIAVIAPLLLVIRHRLLAAPRQAPALSLPRLLECLAQAASLAIVLFIVFGPLVWQAPFKFSFLLFLPLIWIATRHGLHGAAWAVLAAQVGLVAAFVLDDYSAQSVRLLQLLMFAAACTTLMLGASVSEQRRARAELLDSERRLASILDALPDGVVTVDRSGAIQSVNPTMERMFGTARAEVLGRPVEEFVSGRALYRESGDDADRAAGGQPAREIVGRRTDGRRFPIELTACDLEIDGRWQRILVLRDITLRREAEARAEARSTELARVQRASTVGELASAVAHEVNQPLTAVVAYARGCLRLAQQHPLPARTLQDGLGEVASQAERAALIIVRLREFLCEGRSHQVVADASEIVDDVLDLIRAELARAGVTARCAIAHDLPRVFVDRVQIEQVLLNLVRNAIEAMHAAATPDPSIAITAEREGAAFVRLAVSDVGPGVSEEVATRLFEPFTTTKPRGMGLGLSISRSIVESHGGILSMRSNPDRGATFWFTVPVHDGRGHA